MKEKTIENKVAEILIGIDARKQSFFGLPVAGLSYSLNSEMIIDGEYIKGQSVNAYPVEFSYFSGSKDYDINMYDSFHDIRGGDSFCNQWAKIYAKTMVEQGVEEYVIKNGMRYDPMYVSKQSPSYDAMHDKSIELFEQRLKQELEKERK